MTLIAADRLLHLSVTGNWKPLPPVGSGAPIATLIQCSQMGGERLLVLSVSLGAEVKSVDVTELTDALDNVSITVVAGKGTLPKSLLFGGGECDAARTSKEPCASTMGGDGTLADALDFAGLCKRGLKSVKIKVIPLTVTGM